MSRGEASSNLRRGGLLLLALIVFVSLRQVWVLGLLDGMIDASPPHEVRTGEGAAAEGEERCGDCHDEVEALQRRGPHRALSCADCHGPPGSHVVDGEVAGAMDKVRGVARLCARCHRELTRRDDAPSVNLEAHVVEVGALFEEDVCFDCHLPHDPRP